MLGKFQGRGESGEKDKAKEFQMEETYNNQTPRGSPGAGGSWESQHKEKPSQAAASLSPIPLLTPPEAQSLGKASVLQGQENRSRGSGVPLLLLGIGLECLRGQQGAESTTLTQLLQAQLPPGTGASTWARGGDSCVPKSAQRAQGAGRDHGRLQPPGETPGEARAEQNKRDK